jgi:hypothetical protein
MAEKSLPSHLGVSFGNTHSRCCAYPLERSVSSGNMAHRDVRECLDETSSLTDQSPVGYGTFV